MNQILVLDVAFRRVQCCGTCPDRNRSFVARWRGADRLRVFAQAIYENACRGQSW